MVAMALYRGNLHRVPNTARRWPPPPRSLSASQFKALLRRRSLALARLDDQKILQEEEPKKEEEEQEEKEEGEEEEEEEEEEEGELADVVHTPTHSHSDLPVKEQDTAIPEAALTENEERKKELQKKLEELNQKKHNLVQMLKQILNAEEEMKRRIGQSSATRGPVPVSVPSENGPDVPSASRPGPPKMSVEVNFGPDLCGESDPGSTQSAAAYTRPFHQI